MSRASPAPGEPAAGAVAVAIGSGKGGVGKSFIACNLGVLLARRGLRVVLADLDLGGPDLHLLLGLPRPPCTLAAFLARETERLGECVVPIEAVPGLALIAGAGETLAAANLSYPRKRRLLGHLARLEADVVVIDVGAGSGYNALDFFLDADLHVAVATPEPAAVLDMYRFVKLAAVRRVLTAVRPRRLIEGALAEHDFQRMEEVIAAVERHVGNGREHARRALAGYRPHLIANRSSGRALNIRLVREMLERYAGTGIEMLGEIPEDEAVGRSLSGLRPLACAYPESPAARALEAIAARLVTAIGALRGTASS